MGTFLGLLLLVGFAVTIGALFGSCRSEERLADRARELKEQEAKLDAGWQALEKTQRLNQAFWQARQLMREEALRYSRLPGDRSQSE